MSDVGLGADLLLDVRQALAAVDRINEALNRATTQIPVTADTRAVTAAIDAAIQNANAALTVVADATDVTASIDAAVETADSSVVVTGEAADVTGSIDAAVENADTNVVVTGDATELTGDITAAVDAADTHVAVTADTGSAVAGLNAVDAAAGAAVLSSGALSAALGAVGAAAIAKGLFELGQAASDLAESTSKAATVFGAEFPRIAEFAEGAATAIGLSEQAALEATGTFGNLFQALGTTQQEAARLAPDVVNLAADLASFNNLEVDDALEKIRSGLVGEIEPLRALGISFNAAQVDAKGMELGLGDVNGELSEGAKVQARWALITEQSSVAAGDFARTSDGLANQQRILKAELANLAAEAGTTLLPAFLSLVDLARDELIPILGDLADTVLPALAGGVTALTPVLGAALVVLKAAVALLDLVPEPVLTAVAAVYAMSKALAILRVATLAATNPLMGLAVPAGSVAGAFNRGAPAAAGFAGSLRGLTQGFSGAALAAGIGLTAVQLWGDVMDDARARGEKFGEDIRSKFDLAAMSTTELAGLSGELGTQIENLKAEVDDSFFGRNTVNKDFNETLKTAAEEAANFRKEVEAAIVEQNRLIVEARFGDIAAQYIDLGTAVANVRDESTSAADAIEGIRVAGSKTDATFLDLAVTLGDAALSEEAMADAAALLGTDVDSLNTFVTTITESLQTFIDTAVDGLPTVAEAFRDTNEDAKVSAAEFLAGLQEDTAELTAFIDDLKVLVTEGFVELAAELAQQGVEVAGVTAEQLANAAHDGNVALLEETSAGLDARDQVIADSTAFFEQDLGPKFVVANQVVAEAATAAFGANFDPAEQIRIASALAQTDMTEEGMKIAAIAATQGAGAANSYGVGLGLDQEVIAESIKAGLALRANAPVVQGFNAGRDVGVAVGHGMASGILSMVSTVAAAAQSIVNTAESVAWQALDPGSPSRVFAAIGANAGEGLVYGFVQSAAALATEAQNAVLAAAQAATPARLSVARIDPNITAASTGVSAGLGFHAVPGMVVVHVTGVDDPQVARQVGAAAAGGFLDELARGVEIERRLR